MLHEPDIHGREHEIPAKQLHRPERKVTFRIPSASDQGNRVLSGSGKAYLQFVAKPEIRHEKRLEVVVAVGTLPEYVQAQIYLDVRICFHTVPV